MLTILEATAEVIDKDGWLDTGDMGMVDEEGMVYCLDRKKDMIIRGGENVSSRDGSELTGRSHRPRLRMP